MKRMRGRRRRKRRERSKKMITMKMGISMIV